MKTFLNRFLYPACLYFTITVLLTAAIASGGEHSAYAPTISTLGGILIFSLLLSAVDKVFYLKTGLLLRMLLHYCGIMLTYILVFVIAFRGYKQAQGALWIAVILTVLYALVAAIVLLAFRGHHRKENEKQKYQRQFR